MKSPLRLSSQLVALLVISAAQPTASADQPSSAVIRAELKNLRNDAGQVGCALFRSADGFPGDMGKAVEHVRLPIKDKSATCAFKGVPPGIYAVAAIHDENGNGRLDRPTFGAPTEGWGTSRDARAGFMRGPSFDDAALRFVAGTSNIAIAIHYP